MECIFCQIIEKTQPSYIVYEDDLTIAFLDKRPLFKGHCLLLPKAHFETLYDLPPELIEPLFSKAKLLGLAIEKAMAAQGSFVAMNNRISQSVPHVHVHLVPRKKGDGLRGFFWPRATYASVEEMQEIQRKIKQYL